MAGTLLGSTITFMFQRANTARAERFARDERLRQDRIAAYSAFAQAITELRRGVITYWFRKQEDRDGLEARDARTEADRLGAAADHARFRVQLVAGDSDLASLADAPFEPIGALPHVATRAELTALENGCQELLTAFIVAAGAQVR